MSTKIQKSAEMFEDPFTTSADLDERIHEIAVEFGYDEDILQKAIAAIPHKTTKADGSPMEISNIYFLLRISDKCGELIRKAYPFKTFTNDNGIEIQGCPAKDNLLPMAMKLLALYGINPSEAYMKTQLDKLNHSYGF